MSHTPGPWRAVGEVPANIQDQTRWTLARCFYRDFYTDEAGDEHDANARLIAAAPDLLAACEHSVAFLNALIGYAPNVGVAASALTEMLNTAIAKARGEPEPC